MKWRNKLLTPKRIALITTAALTFGTFPALVPHANAEGIKHLDQIRVALLIDSTKYKKVEPVVTLTASGGLDIAVRNSAGTAAKPWASIPDASIRMSIDQYSVIMLETMDYIAAKALYAKLAAMPEDSYVLSRVKQGKTVYQVYYGSFPSKEEAEGAAAQVLKDTTVSALTKSAPPVFKGPLHWSAGTYADEAAAMQQLLVFNTSGT